LIIKSADLFSLGCHLLLLVILQNMDLENEAEARGIGPLLAVQQA